MAAESADAKRCLALLATFEWIMLARTRFLSDSLEPERAATEAVGRSGVITRPANSRDFEKRLANLGQVRIMNDKGIWEKNSYF